MPVQSLDLRLGEVPPVEMWAGAVPELLLRVRAARERIAALEAPGMP